MTSLQADSRKWETTIDLRIARKFENLEKDIDLRIGRRFEDLKRTLICDVTIGHGFEDWMSIRGWT